jgi:hypothetical protein
VNYGVLKANSLLTALAYGLGKSREIASRTDKLINHEPVAVPRVSIIHKLSEAGSFDELAPCSSGREVM